MMKKIENTELHFEMTVTQLGCRNWNEKLTGLRIRDEVIPEPKTNEEAIYLANRCIDYFNKSLRPKEEPRLLINVQRVETKVIDIL